jgi:hypothetical protein
MIGVESVCATVGLRDEIDHDAFCLRGETTLRKKSFQRNNLREEVLVTLKGSFRGY